MKTSSATSVATNDVQWRRGLGYAVILGERFDALSDDERDIIECHKLADSPMTLDELGKLRGVTRERIRQIEGAGPSSVSSAPSPRPVRGSRHASSSPTPPASRREKRQRTRRNSSTAAVEELRALPLPVTESALIESGFGAADALSTRLLLVGAERKSSWRGRFVEYGGRRWLTGEVTPARLVAQITEDAREARRGRGPHRAVGGRRGAPAPPRRYLGRGRGPRRPDRRRPRGDRGRGPLRHLGRPHLGTRAAGAHPARQRCTDAGGHHDRVPLGPCEPPRPQQALHRPPHRPGWRRRVRLGRVGSQAPARPPRARLRRHRRARQRRRRLPRALGHRRTTTAPRPSPSTGRCPI